MAYKVAPTVSGSPVMSLASFSTTLCLAPSVTGLLATSLFLKQVRRASTSGSLLPLQHLSEMFSSQKAQSSLRSFFKCHCLSEEIPDHPVYNTNPASTNTFSCSVYFASFIPALSPPNSCYLNHIAIR